jgi:hypothetical protein
MPRDLSRARPAAPIADRLLAFATGRNGGIDSTFWEPPV